MGSRSLMDKYGLYGSPLLDWCYCHGSNTGLVLLLCEQGQTYDTCMAAQLYLCYSHGGMAVLLLLTWSKAGLVLLAWKLGQTSDACMVARSYLRYLLASQTQLVLLALQQGMTHTTFMAAKPFLGLDRIYLQKPEPRK